jgi:hypothetical protein
MAGTRWLRGSTVSWLRKDRVLGRGLDRGGGVVAVEAPRGDHTCSVKEVHLDDDEGVDSQAAGKNVATLPRRGQGGREVSF